MSSPKLTAAEALAELQRERRMRDQVYPRLIASGKLTRQEEMRRNDRLDRAIELVQALAEAERLI